MITLKEWMELCDYRITEGDHYGWRCFGDNAHSLSSWNGRQDGWSMNIVFDTKTQETYVVEACDYARQRAYRIISADHKNEHDAMARIHDVNGDLAWDDVNYVDLEDDDDFIEKAQAIRDGKDYDTRVKIPVNFPDDVLLTLMKQAHDADITFNQHMVNILKVAIEEAGFDSEEKMWDDLAEDDHWDDEIFEDEAPKKKKKKKS